MIKFKTSKRKRRWDIQDDLSIMTGGRPIIRVGGAKDPRIQRVSKYDEKLKRDFLTARATAYAKRGERPPSPVARATAKNSLSKSPYSSKENFPVSSEVIFPVPSSSFIPQTHNPLEGPRPENGRYTINSLPPLVKVTHSRKGVPRSLQNPHGILKPVHQNSLYPGPPSEAHYFSFHANSGRQQQPKFSTTVCSMNPKGSGKKVSSWKICSSMPMTRRDASIVQMEMASTMRSSEVGSTSGFFSPFHPTNQGLPNQFGDGCMLPPPTTPRQAVPSLVRSIVPPPSPLFPSTPESTNSAPNFRSCGVYQSEWMDRSKCAAGKPITKQYSMEQIIDILCGFATPDSIMADQLFQPLSCGPSMPPTSMNFTEPSATSTVNQSNPLDGNFFQDGDANKENEKEEEDGETSMYFRKPAKKKTVSFLTDSMDNVCVKRHFFDPFSQEHQWSGTNDISPTNKENMNPNIFENFLPLPVSNQVNINCSYGPSPPMPSLYFMNSCNLQDLRGNYFDNTNNSNTNVTGSWADHSQLNAIPSMFPSNSMMQPSFQVGVSAAVGSDNQSTFPTVPPSSPLPIFELGRGNSVELFDNINNSNEVQNATKTGAENSPPKENQQQEQQQTEEKSGAAADSQNINSVTGNNASNNNSFLDLTSISGFSNLSLPSIPYGDTHPSWDSLLNELCMDSNFCPAGMNFQSNSASMNGSILETPQPRILP